VSNDFRMHTCANGLTILGEPMENVTSAAMTISIRLGSSIDPAGAEGSAAVAADWLFRGAGDRDSRAFNDALDALGCHHDESVSSKTMRLSSTQLGCNLDATLDLYADVLRRPMLADEAFDPCRQLVMQDLEGLDDEPSRMCSLKLREQFFPWPLARLNYGTAESLAGLTEASLASHVRRCLTPAEAVISVAGRFDWNALVAKVETLLGGWSGEPVRVADAQPPRGGTMHIEKDSAQTHIGIAQASVPLSDELYYAGRLSEAILSRGMGSRLPMEVREKRGLVYHVSCSYQAMKESAGLFTYAGTRPEVAEETYQVTLDTLRSLTSGIEDDELARAKTQIRSALILQGQSTGARAAAMVNDYTHLGRLRTLDEVSEQTSAVTRDDVMTYVERHPAENLTTVTLGPKPLAVN
jgi:predicted Zn-dependent peptidase